MAREIHMLWYQVIFGVVATTPLLCIVLYFTREMLQGYLEVSIIQKHGRDESANYMDFFLILILVRYIWLVSNLNKIGSEIFLKVVCDKPSPSIKAFNKSDYAYYSEYGIRNT